jgi:L-seryl-tRNA(Ser) seleniumtransferase
LIIERKIELSDPVMQKKNYFLRKIPSVDEILKKTEEEGELRYPRSAVVKAVQTLLEEKRRKILSMEDITAIKEDMLFDLPAAHIKTKIEEMIHPSMKRVINATGIIVHTNLGRAPLSEQALQAIEHAGRYYTNLEFDLENARRGSRYSHVDGLLRELTKSDAAFVVNNNAAAVLLCLNTLANAQEVLVSRGELIEIGGSFRIPEIMKQSGAELVEVGATNRTHLHDYRNAITDRTALIFKAHTSNYRIVGFSSEVDLPELKKLGEEHDIPVMLDMGSGNFLGSQLSGLKGEPTVQEVVRHNIDLITFSGDKLLGGPQAGIIIGSEKYIQMIRKNPLTRALRIDKLTLAALEATLKSYILNSEHIDEIPVINMLMIPQDVLKKRAQKIVKNIKRRFPSLDVSILQDTSQVGGGAYPLHDLPTWAVSINPAAFTANEFETLLRKGTPPVIARISKEHVLLDMRTIFPDEVSLISDSILTIMKTSTTVNPSK